LESEIKRPASIDITHQEPLSEPKEITQDTEEPIAKTPSTPTTNKKFETLCHVIMDRNSDLGECFKEQVHFISYENNVLTWESCADEACKAQLRHGYSIIKQFVKEILGLIQKLHHNPVVKQLKSPCKKKRLNQPSPILTSPSL